ncbi:selenium-binding protein SBP56-related protein [Magnetospira sp. QH-2]|uniref:selenium-binding protein SBP56-related protein n=1 Tax=Magnetospira sp. (strain QH-2) TaxID=1288970 RepID=UPI0003E80D94|nr:selenium-binding protein SBP56-related protein [Magnetospira sp. QH-2]CCQ72465.1 Putative Selenium-binding family protein [Magnetospira sp. QH-2]
MSHSTFIRRVSRGMAVMAVGALMATTAGIVPSVQADETCQSPYMAKITGKEDFIYVWTLGMEGIGDESDKLVTVDVRETSPTYGKVINSVSTGRRAEAHHSGFSDDRHYLWAGGLDDSSIYIYDVHSDPSKPKLHREIKDFVKATGGAVGPHTFYALPGRILITALSNDKDHGGKSALVEYTNEGDYIATYWIPDGKDNKMLPGHELADGYNYDVRVLPRKNVMLSSSFTGWSNYMMDFGKMLQDKEAMSRFGNTVTLWDLHTRTPRKVFSVPGAPLEIRWAWGPTHNYAFTTTALTAKIHLIYEDEKGEWQSKAVADIGDASKVPLPVDISISSDDKELWVDTFMDGTARLFDISDPHHPKQVYEKKIGAQLNMVSQSWDGDRVYFSTSLLANWDKKGADNEQFVKAYDWDGKELKHRFTIDFIKEGLGRAHLMRFGAMSLYQS